MNFKTLTIEIEVKYFSKSVIACFRKKSDSSMKRKGSKRDSLESKNDAFLRDVYPIMSLVQQHHQPFQLIDKEDR